MAWAAAEMQGQSHEGIQPVLRDTLHVNGRPGEFLCLMFLLDRGGVRASVLAQRVIQTDESGREILFHKLSTIQSTTKVPSLACHLELSSPGLASFHRQVLFPDPASHPLQVPVTYKSDGCW